MNKPTSPPGSQANSSPGLSRRAMVQVSTAAVAAPLIGCAQALRAACAAQTPGQPNPTRS